ncbi:hypothetical protein BVRB_7g176450 [Beta vulgaris subsp. vulgaris]|nr:hypothetical protein BVRB_7g176450 [Beta vulgaris subsp. vulgaris]
MHNRMSHERTHESWNPTTEYSTARKSSETDETGSTSFLQMYEVIFFPLLFI